MKKDILKIAGVKSEKEFYKKYPTEEAFMKVHAKAFKKAAMGASMVNKQLKQLSDFANPPQAQVGTYIGGEKAPAAKPMVYGDYFDQVDKMVTGMDRKSRMEQANLAAQQEIAANSNKGGLFGMLGQLAPQLNSLSSGEMGGGGAGVGSYSNGINETGASFADVGKYGKRIPKAQGGFIQGLKNFGDKAGKAIGEGYDKLDTGTFKNIGGVTGAIGIAGDLVGGFQQLSQEKKEKKEAKQFSQLSGVVKDASASRPEETRRRYVRPEDNLVNPGQISGSPYGTGSNFLQAEYGTSIGGNPTEIQNTYDPDTLYDNLGYEPLSESDIVKQYKKGGRLEKGQFGAATQIAGQLGGGLGSLIGGAKGRPTAGGKIGSTVGGTLGNLVLPGVGGILGGALGGLVGGVFGGKSAKQTAEMQEQGQRNIQTAAFQNAGQNIQNQYSGFMRDGGGLRYLSNDWQPQVITKFGDYDLKDLLASPKDADMLRSGGHLKDYSYTPPSEKALQTYALGGQLKTTWGGHAEPVSHNPYLPGSGETVMFRGKSHSESDGNGHTGIGVKYGQGAQDSYTDYAEYGTEQADADVEVERGEPAVELPDSETGDLSMIVFGNMKIPSYGVSELGDNKAKGKKFKHYAADLSKQEKKAEKTKDKALTLIDEVDGDTPFDILKLNTAKAMLEGADAAYMEVAEKKKLLANIQNAILDTAEEMGLESDALAKNKIKPAKDSDMAKFGAKLETAQSGKNKKKTPEPAKAFWDEKFTKQQLLDFSKILKVPVGKVREELKKTMQHKTPTPAQLAAEETQFYKDYPEFKPTEYKEYRDLTTEEEKRKFLADEATRAGIGPKVDAFNSLTVLPTAAEMAAMDARIKGIRDRQSRSPLDKMSDAYNALYPYIRPGIENPIDPNQFTGEMYALATNQLEPVQAQQITPMLEEMPNVSFQDQLNEIQAQTNAAMRLTGNNPAAQAMIASQASAAKNKVLAEQFRANQALQAESRRLNIANLKDTTIKNFGIIDQQQQRQAQAKSATKAQAQEALNSIAEKIGKNKSETFAANVMANMYPQFSYGPQGRIYSTGLTDFNTSLADYTPEERQKIAEAKSIQESKKKKRNGSIVKAIKNL